MSGVSVMSQAGIECYICFIPLSPTRRLAGQRKAKVRRVTELATQLVSGWGSGMVFLNLNIIQAASTSPVSSNTQGKPRNPMRSQGPSVLPREIRLPWRSCLSSLQKFTRDESSCVHPEVRARATSSTFINPWNNK